MIKNIFALSALVVSTSVFASGSFFDHASNYNTPINYDFVQAGMSFGDFNALNVNAERMYNENWIIGGSYEYHAAEELGMDLDLSGFTGKALYRLPASEQGDFVVGGHVGMGWSKLSGYGYSFKDDSFLWGAQAGYRHAFDDKLEVGGKVILANAYSNTEFLLGAEVNYKLSPDFGIGATFDTGSELGHTESLFGIQASFSF